MSKKRKPYLVDPIVLDVADHFLSDLSGSTEADRLELGEAIQRLCEDFYTAAVDKQEDRTP